MPRGCRAASPSPWTLGDILGDILGDDDDDEGEVTDTDACRPLLPDSFANVDADLLALVVEAQHGSEAMPKMPKLPR